MLSGFFVGVPRQQSVKSYRFLSNSNVCKSLKINTLYNFNNYQTNHANFKLSRQKHAKKFGSVLSILYLCKRVKKTGVKATDIDRSNYEFDIDSLIKEYQDSKIIPRTL